jgi:hypothetical protein
MRPILEVSSRNWLNANLEGSPCGRRAKIQAGSDLAALRNLLDAAEFV